MTHYSAVFCRFWCQLIFDSSVHHCIVSYLNEAHRPHDITDATVARCDVPSDVTACQMLLHRLFFLVCLRSSTHHESAANFLDEKIFGDILYENYIFDIPLLMDICVVYGHGNDTTLISKMIGNVFQQQPKYNDDLRAVVPAIQKVMSFYCPCYSMMEQCYIVDVLLVRETSCCDYHSSQHHIIGKHGTCYFCFVLSASARYHLIIKVLIFASQIHVHSQQSYHARSAKYDVCRVAKRQ